MIVDKNTTWETLMKNGLIDVRTHNCSKRAGFVTIQDMLDYLTNGKSLFNIPNCGPKTIAQFNRIMEMCGVSCESVNTSTALTYAIIKGCKYDFENKGIKPLLSNPHLLFRNLSFFEKNKLKELYNTPKETTEIIAQVFKSRFPDYEAFFIGMLYGTKIIAERDSNLNLPDYLKYLILVRYFLLQFDSTCKPTTSYYIYVRQNLIDLESQICRTKGEIIFEQFVLEGRIEIAETRLKNIAKQELSTRAYNILESAFSSFTNLINLMFLDKNNFIQEFPQKHARKTYDEIYNFLSRVHDETNIIKTLDVEELRIQAEQQEYPYLNSYQVKFLKEYIELHGHLPLLFIAYNYILSSDNIQDRIFRDFHGLDYVFKDLNTIVVETGLSYERVRQITNHGFCSATRKYLQNFHIGFYDYFNTSCFQIDKDFIERICEEESLDIPFESAIAIIKCTLEAEQYTSNNFSWLVSSIVNKRIKSSGIFKIVHETLKNDCRYKDTLINIRETIGNDCPDEIVNFIRNYYRDSSELNIVDDTIVIPLNEIYLDKALKTILTHLKEPISLEELYNQYCIQFPNNKHITYKDFRVQVPNLKIIKKIGYNYGLSSWDIFVPKSIRDCVIHILENSTTSIRADKLTEKVQKHFPSTSQRSITASMQNDQDGRFVHFTSDYYGLADKKYDDKYIVEIPQEKVSFEDRTLTLQLFIETYHRFPVNSTDCGEEEASLANWYGRVKRKEISISTNDQIYFDEIISPYYNIGYPEDGNEYLFWQYCESYRDFVLKNYELPSSENKMHSWMRQQISKYEAMLFETNRKIIFENMLRELQPFGFYTNYNLSQDSLLMVNEENVIYGTSEIDIEKKDKGIDSDSGNDVLIKYEHLFSSLHTHKLKGSLAPHKAILLIAILNLIDSGELGNMIFISDNLKEEFEKVKNEFPYNKALFKPDIYTPFNHMSSEPFWHYDQECSIAYIDEELYNLIQQANVTDSLELLLIENYKS